MSNGKSPSLKRTRYEPQATDPVNPREGDFFYADGTARTEGVWYYNGVSWIAIGQSGLREQQFLSSSTWEAPDGVTQILVTVVGGGGGGGGGAGVPAASGAGGGGGAGGAVTISRVNVTPGSIYNITVGAGGAGGLGGLAGGAGVVGTAGGQSRFEYDGSGAGTYIVADGGYGGNFAQGNTQGAAIGTQYTNYSCLIYGAGNGGTQAAAVPAIGGANSPYSLSGEPGTNTVNAFYSGAGGGGGASYICTTSRSGGPGGNAVTGVAGQPGGDGLANTGGGGGGGSGSSLAGQRGGTGGAGGTGLVIINY